MIMQFNKVQTPLLYKILVLKDDILIFIGLILLIMMGNKLKDKVHYCNDKTFLWVSIDTAVGCKHTLPYMTHQYNVFLLACGSKHFSHFVPC